MCCHNIECYLNTIQFTISKIGDRIIAQYI